MKYDMIEKMNSSRENDFEKELENLENNIYKISRILLSIKDTEKNNNTLNSLMNLYNFYIEEKNRLLTEKGLIENEDMIPYDTDPELNKLNELIYGKRTKKNDDDTDF
jgi:hypothetical protein